MHFNMMLRHSVVKLIRRYLEDTHGFVEVPSAESLSSLNSDILSSLWILILAHGYKVD